MWSGFCHPTTTSVKGNDMSFSDIQDTPLDINLKFVQVNDTSPSDHHLCNVFIRSVLLAQLPPNVQAVLTPLLSTPLDQMFDTMWSQQVQDGTAQNMAQQAVQGARPNAYNIIASFPSTGSLRAQVADLSPGMLATLPPGTNAKQLTLSFILPGVSITWSETTNSIWDHGQIRHII